LRIKTDENIAARAVQLLRNAGHDVGTSRRCPVLLTKQFIKYAARKTAF